MAVRDEAIVSAASFKALAALSSPSAEITCKDKNVDRETDNKFVFTEITVALVNGFVFQLVAKQVELVTTFICFRDL